jgi:hypothetical protein
VAACGRIDVAAEDAETRIDDFKHDFHSWARPQRRARSAAGCPPATWPLSL